MQKLLIICLILFIIPPPGSARTWGNKNGVVRIPVRSYYNAIFFTDTVLGEEGDIFLSVMLDTTTSDLWFPSSDCDMKFRWCTHHRRYNHRESTSYINPHRNFTLTAEVGPETRTVSGRVSIDQVVIDDLTMKNKAFGEAISSTNLPGYDFYDGVLGLGISATSPTGTPVLQTLLQDGVLDDAVFSFSLTGVATSEPKYVGDLVIGGVDHDRYSGSLTWAKLTSHEKWEISSDSVDLGEKNLCKGSCKVEFSTGIEIIVGPDSQVAALYEVLDAKPIPGVAMRSVDCAKVASYPSLSFTVNGVPIVLTPSQYVHKEKILSSEYFCYLSIMSFEDQQSDGWILGAMAHRPLYIVYNFGAAQIGLAQAV